jgi:putative ABC transport system substrate-binding protein
MNRRAFVTGLGAVLAAPLAAEAESPAGRIPRVGLLSDEALTDEAAAGEPAFRMGLEAIGYVQGQNIVVERRLAEWNSDRLPALASELVKLKVDIIVAIGTAAARAAANATKTVPIVFTRVADPVALGLVPNLARPRGNITGLAVNTTEIAAKRLELLLQAVPGLRRIDIVWDPSFPPAEIELRRTQEPTRSLRVELHMFPVRDVGEFEKALATVTREHVGAIEVLPATVFTGQRQRIADLVAKARLPAMFQRREFVVAGGLMSYGPSYAEMYRRAAIYVDKLVKGAKPADLPVEQPTRVELVVNTKTAKALGLTIPPSLLLRADQVIE